MDPITILLFFQKYWKFILAAIILGYVAYRIDDNGYQRAARYYKAEIADSQELLHNAIKFHGTAMDLQAKRYEEQIANARPVIEIVRKTIIKEIEKPIYKECKVPTTGVDVIRTNVDALNSLRDKFAASKEPFTIEQLKLRLEKELKRE